MKNWIRHIWALLTPFISATTTKFCIKYLNSKGYDVVRDYADGKIINTKDGVEDYISNDKTNNSDKNS